MRTTLKLALAVGIAVALGGKAQAQGGRGFGFGMGSGAGLLMAEPVQKDLKLSDEQVTKIESYVEAERADMREKFQGLGQGLSQEERREKMTALMAEMRAQADKDLKDMLSEEQLSRFKQIRLQAAGAQAFSEKDVQAKLNLTDEQKTKIADIEREQGEKMREIFGEFQNDREGAMQKMQDLREETLSKAKDVLTDEQKATWKEMIGTEIELPTGPGRGGRGGRRNP